MVHIETIAEGVTLYCGDCREILPTLANVNAIIADGPYGKRERTKRKTIGRGSSRTTNLHGSGGDARDWPEIYGDNEPFDPTPWLKFRKVILFGANHFSDRLPPNSNWIIWDKRENSPPDDNGDCELAWTNLKGPPRIHRQLWRGICRRGEEAVSPAKPFLHPTQKPIALMDFCIRACRLSPGETVLDPYMGSGPIGVAAVRLGLRYIGIERERQYFDIACRRIADASARLDLFIEPQSAARPRPA